MNASLQTRHDESLRLLMRAIAGQSTQFRLLIATFGDSVYRDEIVERINRETSRPSAVISVAGLDARELEQELVSAAEHASLIHVVETRQLIDEREGWMNRLNYAREELANRCPASVILWLYDEEASEFARRAPDLWAWRRGIYEFTESSERGGEDGARVDDDRLIETFAELFYAPEEAMMLLRRAGFPSHWTPAFSTPTVFWHTVFEQARQGALRGGPEAIVEAAASVYPHNPSLRSRVVALDALRESKRGTRSSQKGSPSPAQMTLARERGVRLMATHDYEGARAHFVEALGHAKSLGDHRSIGHILGFLGRTFEAQGDLGAAMEKFQQSVSFLEDTEDIRSHSIAVGDVARGLQLQGANDRAYALYENILDKFESMGDMHEQAVVLAGMARVHVQRGEFEEARRCYDRALALAERLGERRIRAIFLGEKARLSWRRGNPDEALALHEEQRQILSKLGDVRELAVVLGDLARIHRSRGEVDRALSLDEERLEINRTLGNVAGTANALWAMGRDRARHDPEGALSLLRESYQLCVDVEQSEAIVTVGYDLGQALIGAGRGSEARVVLTNVYETLRSLGRDAEAEDVQSALEEL